MKAGVRRLSIAAAAAIATTAAMAAFPVSIEKEARSTFTFTPGRVDLYFSPNGGAEQAVVQAIRHARRRILVQAYTFSSPPIYQALAAAKLRGVAVALLLDQQTRNADGRGTGARFDQAYGIAVAVDTAGGKGIAHSKVIVIDEATVITGSFNFSRQAETLNVENLLVFHDSPELARAFAQQWMQRAAVAVPY